MSDQQPAHFALDKLPVKLEGASNYTTWCTYVKAALKGQNLFGHITGKTVRPAVDSDAKGEDEWDRRDEKAQSIIMLGVTPTMVNHIAGDMTAKEMWDKLATQCRRKDMATRVSLMQQLFTARLRDAESVDKHISAMNDIRTQLANIGKPIDDAVAAIALLLSVPAEVPQWEMFLRSHTTGGRDPAWDDVSAAMRAEASLQHQRDRTLTQPGSEATVVAYATSAKGHKQTLPQHRDGSRPYCTHCNRKGHVVETCWALHPELRKQRQPQTEYAMAVTVSDANNSTMSIPGVGMWHVDSGASSHLTGNRAWFTELHQCVPCTVTVADHGTLTCTQRGTVVLKTQRGRITVRNVLFVPSLGVNLLSVSAIVHAGMRVRFTKSGCSIRTSRNKLIVQAVAHNNIYSVYAAPQPSVAAYSVTSGTSEALSWVTIHARMGHLNPRAMQTMLDKGMALGITLPSAGSPTDIDQCAGCLAGKSHRQPFPAQATHRATQPLQLVHSDICGPIQTGSGDKDNSKRYIITFIDDYSRFTWVAITSDKTGKTALNQFIRYKVWAERHTGFAVKTLRTDGGGEYINDQFSTYLYTMGIERQVTVARTPQQNGVAERANRTIMEAARSMLHAAGLPLQFWEYAVMTAVYLRNRSPTKALTDATPYEAWRGDKPDLSHLRVFGCRAYMHLDKTKRNKIQPRSIPVIFVGYAAEAKGWLVYDPVSSNRKTHISRDVTFHESVPGSTLLTTAVSAAEPAVINSTSSSSTTRAAEPVDTGRLSMIDILLDTDTESDSDHDNNDSARAAEPTGQQLVSQLASRQRVTSESPASNNQPASISQPVVSERPAIGSTEPSTSPPATVSSIPHAVVQTSKERKRLSRSERELRLLASHNKPGRTDLGEAQFILGVQIRRNRDRRQLYLSQHEYVRTVLKRFRMEDCKPAASPMATGVKLLRNEPKNATSTDSEDMSKVPYSSAVGALMYAALVTRPDIAYAVTALCQFMASPAVSHWNAVKRVFRYLQGTAEYELVYGWKCGVDQPLYGYSDSDWGNDVNDRRSVTGWVFLLHDGAVSWQSCKQPTVALSSVEAEYMAATQATREAVWWRAFLTELGMPPTTATTIYSDSQGAIALAKKPEHHKRTKHIDIQHHYVREQTATGSVILSFIGTENMVADVLTKPLAAARHTSLSSRMGVN